jgi:hypothetical protein
MSPTALNKLIEEFSQLPMDDKEYAVDVIRKQLTEARRNATFKLVTRNVDDYKAVKELEIFNLFG